jgi:hypothetical protein
LFQNVVQLHCHYRGERLDDSSLFVARHEASAADLTIVLGSSLSVPPANNLVLLGRRPKSKRNKSSTVTKRIADSEDEHDDDDDNDNDDIKPRSKTRKPRPSVELAEDGNLVIVNLQVSNLSQTIFCVLFFFRSIDSILVCCSYVSGPRVIHVPH